MASAARKIEYAYAPSRVYSYSSAATAEALPQYEPGKERIPAGHDEVYNTHVHREPSPRAQRKRRTVPKFISFAGVIMTAAVLVFMILRYATIASEWSKVNEIEQDIAASRRRIAELEVQLDEAINIDEAKISAAAAGLGYPTAQQIVNVKGGTDGD